MVFAFKNRTGVDKLMTCTEKRRITAGVAGFLLILLFTPAICAQTYTDLFDFAGSSCCPQYPFLMAQGRDGNLYGTIASGGTNSAGFVFQITPTGTYKVLYNFDTVHGSTPIGGLALGTDGNLYGTTEEGGAHGFGNVFKITPAGVLTVLYDFAGGADGGHPVSPLVLGFDGLFHGTSYPGMSYKISASGAFHVIGTIPAPHMGLYCKPMTELSTALLNLTALMVQERSTKSAAQLTRFCTPLT